jgi:kinetochore protein NDC80
MISELGANFEKRNEHTLAEAADLSQQVDSLDAEYQKLTKEEPPLAKAQREKGIYLSDIEKFKKFISHLTVKKQKFIESIERFEEDVGLIEKELGEFELQRAALQAQVDAQDICPEDIDRMNADKDQLIRTLESLNQNKEETSKIFWDRELQVQKRLDNVQMLS